MSVPESFYGLQPYEVDTLCRLVRETAVIVSEGETTPTPVVWDMVQSLYADDKPWRLERRPKRRGFRTIHAPQDPLKVLSRGILHHVLRRIPVHMCVHGSEPRTSVKTNAQVHAGFARSLYNLDLKDAFPNTDRARMMANLRPKIESMLLQATDLDEVEAKRLSEVLIDLCVVEVHRAGGRKSILPQGFPTSTGVLNIVLMPVDRKLSRLMRQLSEETGGQWRYSRYVDDLTISTDLDRMTKAQRKQIRDIIRKEGWKINNSKTAYCGDAEPGDEERSTKEPVVTGLVIHPDGSLSIPRWKLHKWRGYMGQVLQMDELDKKTRESVVGIISFCAMIYDGEPIPNRVLQPYLKVKAKFGLGDASRRRERYPERGVDSP